SAGLGERGSHRRRPLLRKGRLKKMRILGMSGSLREGSYNTSLLCVAAGLLPDDVQFELWGRLKEVPPYDEDDDTDEAPAAVAAFREAIAGADAGPIATPEYNPSIPR